MFLPMNSDCPTAYLWDCRVDVQVISGCSTSERQLWPPSIMVLSVALLR